MKLLLAIAGIVCFAIDAFKAWLLPGSRVNFLSLGLAFIAGAVFLPL